MTIMNIDKYGDDLVYRPTHEGNILLTALHLNPGIDINISADKRYKLAAKTPRLASGMKAAFYLTNI